MDKKDWPIYGIVKNHPVKRQPYFRIQSRNLYVDMPNHIILIFIDHLNNIVERLKGKDVEEIYKEFKKSTNEVNDSFSKKYPWLKFVIRKETFSQVPIGVQVRINWKEFEKFIREFPADDKTSLAKKYEYLFACKRAGLIIVLRGKEFRIKDTQEGVKKIVEKDIENTLRLLDSLCRQINKYKTKLLQGARRKEANILTLEYLPEMYFTLSSLKYMVSNGIVTPCYREMRKILANLCWAIFNDVLYLRSLYLRAGNADFIQLYATISQEWYMKSRGINHTLKDLGNLRKYMKNITDKLHFYGRMKNYNWSKRQIREMLLDTIDYSLIIALTGCGKNEYDGDEGVQSIKIDQLKNLIAKSIEITIHRLKNKRLGKSDKKLVTELTEGITGNRKELIPAFPSDKFVMEFVGRIAGLNLYEMYKNYSVFVHSYPFSWQTFPYSSVLEYKILLHEVDKFRNAIIQIFDAVPELKQL